MTPQAPVLFRRLLGLGLVFGLIFRFGVEAWSSIAQAHNKPPSPRTVIRVHDQRIAVLVGNQEGWEGDPKLRYVLTGDLRPLAKQLTALGFRVVALEDQEAPVLRQKLQEIAAEIQGQAAIQTFLFYYSGHADQQALHLGPKRRTPFTYAEFSSFFARLRVERRIAIFDSCYSGEAIRQFGSLQRYESFLKTARAKGIRRRRMIDLHKLVTPDQGQEQGVRILASSLDLSWEIQRYQASTFTHHLLQGLQGKADLDHDGRITFDELFDYTSQKVSLETGQRPQQLVFLQRQDPYAIAPAYRSRLRIGRDVLGQLKIAVSNFVWVQKKEQRKELRLAIVDGEGTVFLERKGQCWQQAIRVPKGQEIHLGHAWQVSACQVEKLQRKGMIQMPAHLHLEPPIDPTFSIALVGFLGVYQLQPFQTMQGGGGLHFRFLDRFGFGFYVDHGKPEGRSFTFTHLLFKPEVGLTLPFFFEGHALKLFFGLHGLVGATLQYTLESPQTVVAITSGGGVHLDLSWWFSRHLGLRVGVQANLRYTPILHSSGLTLQGGGFLALLFGR